MIWILSFLLIIIIAFVVIKISLNTKENPESNLGILEHPSTFQKPKIEMVEKTLNEDRTTNDSINLIN